MKMSAIQGAAVVVWAACLLGGEGAAAAADYLGTVKSEVYQTTGTHQEITKRAITCVTQHIRPGLASAPTITSSDPESGMIVANNGFYYSSGGFMAARVMARSTLTFEAKDGRFRITHTNIENFNSMRGGWGPIGLWSFGGGDDANDALQAISRVLATCVQDVTKPADNW